MNAISFDHLFLLLIWSSCLLAFVSIWAKINPGGLYWLVALTAAGVSGIRNNVGKDFSIYSSIFQGRAPVSISEPGFNLLVKTLAGVDESGGAGFLFSSFVVCAGYAFAISKLGPRHRLLSLHLFLCLPPFYVSSFNLIRQHMVIALCMVLFALYMRGNKSRYLLTIPFMASVHFSSTIYLFILPFIHSGTLFKIFYRGAVLFVCFLPPLVWWLEERFVTNSPYAYFLDHSSENSRSLAVAFILLNLGLFMFLRGFSRGAPAIRRFGFVSLFCAIILLEIWLFSSLANFWFRLGMMYFFPVLLLLPYALSRLSPPIVGRILSSTLVLSASLLITLKWIADSSFGFLD